jgi:hypothetical protein
MARKSMKLMLVCLCACGCGFLKNDAGFHIASCMSINCQWLKIQIYNMMVGELL